MDVFGKALLDFNQHGQTEKLWLHNNYGKPEDMLVEVFFRTEEDLTDLEEYALNLWFKWLYIDFDRLSTVALKHGLNCELLF